ncbi:MAG: signal peptide peptidase SppA [Ignavibacteria bacterium]|nr:signal peptide peptidase SppA [Ignavibacteria bacterium]
MDTPNTPYSQDPSHNPQYPRYPRYEPYERRRSRWWIPLLIFLVIIFGFFALIAGVIVSISSAFDNKKTASVKEHSVLHIKLAGAVEERVSDDPLAFFSNTETAPSFYEMLSGIRRAKNDENITGIFLDGGIRAGGAKLAEIRAALEDFKTSGKFIYAHLDYGAERDYYTASVADSIFMPTEGLLEMNGFSAMGVFFKGTLEKIGVDFYVEQFEEFKSAVEPYSRTQYSDPAKQELRELLQQRSKDFVNVVAQSRSMKTSAVESVLQRGVYTADSLLALGFIDGIRSKNAVKEALKLRAYSAQSEEIAEADKKQADSATAATESKSDKKSKNSEKSKDSEKSKGGKKSKDNDDDDTAGKLRLVGIGRYVNSDSYAATADDENVSKDKQIAIIFSSGTIVSSGDDDGQIVSGAFNRDLRKARENKKVKAIILRIDSPGGSVFASDEMWEEIRKTAKEKPVYASMSDVAASGGYYMAMACDTIIAHPNTITGSIGVLLLLPNATQMLEKIGVTVDTVTTSPAAIDYDPALRLTDANKKRIHDQSSKIYQRFVQRVSESRHKSFEETRSVAKGRVWTGAAALDKGLVDTLGGLYTAIGIAKRRIGIPDGQRVSIRRYPSNESNRYERIFKRLLNDDDDEEAATKTTLEKLRARVDAEMVAKNPFWKALSESVRQHCLYLYELASMNPQERVLMALPNIPDIR